ncbi:MAG: hypothetical protein AAFQ94_27035 [Bacteroidota bacterium]
MKVLTREELAELKGGLDRNYLNKKDAKSSNNNGSATSSGSTSSSDDDGIDWLHEAAVGFYSAVSGPLITAIVYAST